MTIAIGICGFLVAVVAGARSTWSPCGLSMLSSITPLAERGRGHRYPTTAAWFVAGGVLGGLALGGLMALAALAVAASHLAAAAAGAVAGTAALLCAASDARVGGFSLPIHRRQVNELWLDGYRSWVYGMGFGWQIGSGLATYVMTAGVYLTVVLGAMTGRPWVALAVGAAFGTVRGSAVLLGRRIDSTEALLAFHRRFNGLSPAALAVTVSAQLGAGLVLLWLAAPALAVGGGAAAVLALGVGLLVRRRSGGVLRA